MNNADIKLWRAKEIAKLFLLKSLHKVSFSEDRLFDLLILIGENPGVELGLFVLLSDTADEDIKEQIENIQTEKVMGCDIPVLLMLIDDAKELGKLSFVVKPNGKQLTAPSPLRFHPLNTESLSNCLQEVVLWGSLQNRKTA